MQSKDTRNNPNGLDLVPVLWFPNSSRLDIKYSVRMIVLRCVNRNSHYSASYTRPTPSISFRRWTERRNWNGMPSNSIFPPTIQARRKPFKIPPPTTASNVLRWSVSYALRTLCRFRSFSRIAFRERRSTSGHRAR